MEKFCIFCGKTPRSKNMEHVIPQWLIKLTGDSARKINLGIDFNNPDSPLRSYAFNQFKFPSCQLCNSKFGELESKAKPIIENILNDNPLSASDFNTFFDWLDKVRIGLWLAFFYLDNNAADIEPNYHITFRVGIYDRMSAIYKANDDMERISFIASNTPAFQYYPSCFTLVINKYYFFNLSSQFLFSRRIGFPYPKTQLYDPTIKKVAVDLDHSRNRVMYPLIRKSIWDPCKQIYQPMFSSPEFSDELKNEYYDNEYIRSNSLDWHNGVGCIYLQHNGKIINYSQCHNKSWIPEKGLDRDIIEEEIVNQTLDFQIYMMGITPITDSLTEEHKKYIEMQLTFAKRFNKALVKEYNKTIAQQLH